MPPAPPAGSREPVGGGVGVGPDRLLIPRVSRSWRCVGNTLHPGVAEAYFSGWLGTPPTGSGSTGSGRTAAGDRRPTPASLTVPGRHLVNMSGTRSPGHRPDRQHDHDLEGPRPTGGRRCRSSGHFAAATGRSPCLVTTLRTCQTLMVNVRPQTGGCHVDAAQALAGGSGADRAHGAGLVTQGQPGDADPGRTG
jgi:hypothetical protein